MVSLLMMSAKISVDQRSTTGCAIAAGVLARNWPEWVVAYLPGIFLTLVAVLGVFELLVQRLDAFVIGLDKGTHILVAYVRLGHNGTAPAGTQWCNCGACRHAATEQCVCAHTGSRRNPRMVEVQY